MADQQATSGKQRFFEWAVQATKRIETAIHYLAIFTTLAFSAFWSHTLGDNPRGVILYPLAAMIIANSLCICAIGVARAIRR